MDDDEIEDVILDLIYGHLDAYTAKHASEWLMKRNAVYRAAVDLDLVSEDPPVKKQSAAKKEDERTAKKH